MSLQSVKDFFSARHIDIEIIELPVSTATVALAAVAHGVEPGQIAKTLAFKLSDGLVVLVVAKGDARIDNKKFKDAFGKGKMLGLDEVAVITGHPVGGVCPFGLASPLSVYLDVSLKIYKEVIPAAGSVNSAVRISPEKFLFVLVGRKIIKDSQAQSTHQNQCDVELRQFKDVGQQESGHQDQADEAGHALQRFHAMFLLINSETSQREERNKRASFW